MGLSESFMQMSMGPGGKYKKVGGGLNGNCSGGSCKAPVSLTKIRGKIKYKTAPKLPPGKVLKGQHENPRTMGGSDIPK